VSLPQIVPPTDIRLDGLRRLAFPLALLSFVVMALSVYLRLDYAGLGCSDWLACYAQQLADPAARPGTDIARLLHRLTATTTLILTLLITWKSLRPTPIQPVAYYATLLLALMLLLSAIGIVSSEPYWVVVNFLNILGGLGLVSFSCRTYMATCPAPADSTRIDLHHRLTTLGLYCLTATIVLGSLIGASYAATACASLSNCGEIWRATGVDWAALNPFRHLTGPITAGNAEGAALHVMHRILAILTVLTIGLASWRSLRVAATRRGAFWIFGLLCATALIGFTVIESALNLWITLAHGLCAAALLVAIARQQVSYRQNRLHPTAPS
jgi:cytochrome c oxidase assembly protein subunit 15